MSACDRLVRLQPARNAFLGCWDLGRCLVARTGTFALYATIPLALLFANARALDSGARDSAHHLGSSWSAPSAWFICRQACSPRRWLLPPVGIIDSSVSSSRTPCAGLGPLHRTLLRSRFSSAARFCTGRRALLGVVRPLELPVGVDGARGCPVFAPRFAGHRMIIAADHPPCSIRQAPRRASTG
jgi:hypothetical protein